MARRSRSLPSSYSPVAQLPYNTRFVKVPFTSDLRKVQNGDNWVSQGIVALSKDYDKYVNNMPELNNIPSAIVGERCLVPFETPVKDENGDYVVIDQSFNLSENLIDTRDIIFP